jgi:hypothetical protein
MQTRLLIAVAVAIAVAPINVAGATAQAAVRHDRDPARAALQRWQTSQRATLRRTMATSGLATAPADEQGDVQGSLESAGDLNGDKLPDVLDLRQMVQGSTRLLGITARTGRSGRRLWQRTVSLSVNGFAIAQPERVGPRDKPGVLVVTSQQTAATSGGFGVSLRLREYAGKAGHLLWTTTLNGSIDSGGQFVDVPQLVGLLPVRGQAPDLLVDVFTTSGSVVETTTAEVVEAANGSFSQRGDPQVSTDRTAVIFPIPDVSGDGNGDLLALVAGAPGKIQALDGITGSPLWTVNQDLESPDFASVFRGFASTGRPAIAVGRSLPSGHQIEILDGRTGHIVFARSADAVLDLKHAGRHLVRAIGFLRGKFTARVTTTTETVAFTAVSTHGSVIEQRHISVSQTNPATVTQQSGGLSGSTIGDVQPDGAQETAVFVDVGVNGKEKDRDVIVDGRTGRVHDFRFQGSADGSLRRGPGTDLAGVNLHHGQLRLSAWRGVTRRRYYRRTLHVRGRPDAFVTGLRVTGHHCSDLALNSDGNSATVGVLTARGTLLWSVHFNKAQPVGGTVHRHKRKHYCVA